MIKLWVMSKDMAEGIKVFPSTRLAIISITSPEQPDAEIIGENVFRFKFHDIREDLIVHNTLWRALDVDMANDIAEVIINNKYMKSFVIHCEAGISRSPAVALAISKFFETNPDTEKLELLHPSHNRYVRKMIEEAIERRIRNELDTIDIGG